MLRDIIEAIREIDNEDAGMTIVASKNEILDLLKEISVFLKRYPDNGDLLFEIYYKVRDKDGLNELKDRNAMIGTLVFLKTLVHAWDTPTLMAFTKTINAIKSFSHDE